MSSLVVENNGVKRKRDGAAVEKVKKKKNKLRVEDVETKAEPEKVKKKKKKRERVETSEKTDRAAEKVEEKNSRVETVETEAESGDENTKETLRNSSVRTDSNSVAKPKKVRNLPTVSIAVPGSILDNAQSPEFRTYLAGQIARAACIYKIDEVRLVFVLCSSIRFISKRRLFIFNFFFFPVQLDRSFRRRGRADQRNGSQ